MGLEMLAITAKQMKVFRSVVFLDAVDMMNYVARIGSCNHSMKRNPFAAPCNFISPIIDTSLRKSRPLLVGKLRVSVPQSGIIMPRTKRFGCSFLAANSTRRMPAFANRLLASVVTNTLIMHKAVTLRLMRPFASLNRTSSHNDPLLLILVQNGLACKIIGNAVSPLVARRLLEGLD